MLIPALTRYKISLKNVKVERANGSPKRAFDAAIYVGNKKIGTVRCNGDEAIEFNPPYIKAQLDVLCDTQEPIISPYHHEAISNESGALVEALFFDWSAYQGFLSKMDKGLLYITMRNKLDYYQLRSKRSVIKPKDGAAAYRNHPPGDALRILNHLPKEEAYPIYCKHLFNG